MTLVIAHRGAEFPEHSLAGYLRAIELGVDGVECDVRLTADHELVLMHDATVERTSHAHGSIASMTLAQLKTLDFDGQPIATLREVLTVLKPSRLSFSIETKHPHRFSRDVEAATISLVDEMEFPRDRVRIMSFSAAALKRAYEVAPGIPRVYLEEALPLSEELPAHATIAGPGVHQLRTEPEFVERMHDHGRQVHVWTVDTPEDIDFCMGLGVDALITNRSAAVLAHLGR